MILCFDRAHIIAKNNLGDQVELQERVCHGIGGSFTVYLNLLSARTGKKTTFFSYEQGNAEPVVSWEGDNVLVVDISHVAAVDDRVDSVGDMKIRYKIGEISNRQN
jgi:hypothetical protein